jgi:hypothetical protein
MEHTVANQKIELVIDVEHRVAELTHAKCQRDREQDETLDRPRLPTWYFADGTLASVGTDSESNKIPLNHRHKVLRVYVGK